MNLPDMYARVCAVRPELAVVYEGRTLYYFPGLEGWGLQHPRTKTIAALAEYREFNDICAAALILARWVEALPKYHVLANLGKIPQRDANWLVYEMGTGGDYTDPGRDSSPTPIEALAAFYLGEA